MSVSTENEGQRGEVLKLLLDQRSRLFGFVLSIVRDFDRAEDVFQDVSLVICESHSEFELGTDFGAWSREIARRRILSHHRAHVRGPVSLPDEALKHIQAGFDALEKVDNSMQESRVKAMRGCLEKVESAARKFLAMRYEKGMRLEEMAAESKQHPESIRKALYRTRQILRECIERRMRREGPST